jgi:crotonobetainyl-CoA:carnitine CoA-transferase CaiB-like acyl-CoA transferase
VTGALQHLRVLDLTRILAGPWSTQILADMGAEVIKIERPGCGDDTRAWGPPFLEDAAGVETGDSAYFLCANRGKHSVTLDISRPEGQKLIRELARTSDILVENYKVGTLARYGLSYEDLARVNPGLIYCSITGFGQTGPRADLPGYDFVFQGMSGLMSITGQPAGTPGDEPMKSGIAMGDIVTGMYATVAILAAIEHRHASGKGQYIDMSLLDCTTAITSYQALNYMLSGNVPRRLGNAHSNMVPYQVFACREGDLILAVGNDQQFVSFCKVIGREDLASDPRFVKVTGRNIHRTALIPQVAEELKRRTMEEWVELLEAANVPCGPIHTFDQVFNDPQIQHRGIFQSLPHSAGVDAPIVASPIRLSETPVVYHRAAPVLGEHTDEVLQQRAGLSAEEIADLRVKGII